MRSHISSFKIYCLLFLLSMVILSFNGSAQYPEPGATSSAEAFQGMDDKSQKFTSGFSCRSDSIRNQFDFWVGAWEVFVDGEKVAKSQIERTLGGCMILENYHNLKSGYAGKSMNFYDAKQQQWIQIWTDTEGSVSRYQGKKRGEKMYFSGINNLRDGSQTLVRMEFTPFAADSVRQIYEQSTDGGTSWETLFDGIYRPPKR